MSNAERGRIFPRFCSMRPLKSPTKSPRRERLSRPLRIVPLVCRFMEVYPLLGKGCECLEFLPAMDNRAGINFRDPLKDAVAEFLPRVDSDVSQESARHFAEKGLGDVEPRTLGGSEHILETVGSGCQI